MRPATRDPLEPRAPRASARSPLPADDDATLVARARGGERWAEDALYRRHAASLTRLCTRLLGRRADADDVVQDTFLCAFAKLGSLREPAAVRAWLVRIAVHRARRKLRTRRLLTFCGLGQPEDTPLAALAHDHTRPDLRLELERIDAALAEEAAELRVAWVLRRVDGLSLKETAEATGRSLATIKRYIAAVDSRIARRSGSSDV